MTMATRNMCDERVFLHMDTVSTFWNSTSLHSQVCDNAVGSPNGTVIPGDTTVFTHSMGNLIFAGALLSARCSLSTSAKWISMSGLWDGSKAADWVSTVCANGGAGIPWVLKKAATALHYCNGSTVNNAYASMATTDPGLAAGVLRRVAEKFVSASLCGTSPYGIGTKYSVELEALSTAVNYGEPNDGMVGIDSCKLGNRSYTTDYHSNFYTGKLNHADGTMRNGDGANASNSPLLWVANISAGASRPGGSCYTDGQCTSTKDRVECCSFLGHGTAACSSGWRCGCVKTNMCANRPSDCCTGSLHKTLKCGMGVHGGRCN